MFKHAFWVPLVIALVGCASAAQHRAAVQDDSGDRLTVGTVQREIKVGMSSAQVAEVLGSPNIVSTDTAYSTSSGGISALVLGFGSDVSGGVGGSMHSGAGASSTSQRTLTIIIKYDDKGMVRDFAYHTSKF